MMRLCLGRLQSIVPIALYFLLHFRLFRAGQRISFQISLSFKQYTRLYLRQTTRHEHYTVLWIVLDSPFLRLPASLNF